MGMKGYGHLLVVLVALCITAGRCGDHPDGQSSVSREQDALGNYRFSYSVANDEGEQFRSEGTDALGRVVGSYGLKHIDGTHRVVEYVADKDGFRAEVKSNEPGIVSAEAADASIVKTDEHVHPLHVAASTDDESRETFGKRLKPLDTSRVSYVSESDSSDQATREQRNFDDYRPLSPVAYYPGQAPNPVLQSSRPVDIPRSPRVLAQRPESDVRSSEVYYPPIDPHTAIRRPGYFLNRDRDDDKDFRLSTTSRRPYIPPYGGFDDDPLPEVRRPGITVNSNVGRAAPATSPTPHFSTGRLPPVARVPIQRDFSLPRFPPNSGFPSSSLPHPPSSGSVFPSYPNQGIPPSVLFHPPSYNNGAGSPNFVLRAVPIPNGVQAVRVDPTTGHIYERLVYPLFLRDEHPVYDRNILLHNDDVDDEDESRNDSDGGYYDMPMLGRPFRSARNQPGESRDRTRRPNATDNFEEKTLSYPTAKDMAWIEHQLSMVEGFDRSPVNNRIVPSSLPYHDSSYQEDDDFDSDHPQYGRTNPSSRLRSLSNPQEFDYAIRDGFSRNPRHNDGLSVEDSKEEPSLKEAESSAETKQVKTEGSKSDIEKEGN
ncbi:uncharacterized protein LOC129962420 [Argiope bruennichi]|uniref:uncharacterized protein LOC129962420 n=1 Tax=Argiope bruennichi TaxID=94029 RepID=UPI00249421D2|nr:uncharacterized protein LOC129962420 [Argiope bruennichi]